MVFGCAVGGGEGLGQVELVGWVDSMPDVCDEVTVIHVWSLEVLSFVGGSVMMILF